MDVNARTNDGVTSLHWAAAWGDFDIVVWLVEETDINVDITDNEGRTAFDLAWGQEISDYLSTTNCRARPVEEK